MVLSLEKAPEVSGTRANVAEATGPSPLFFLFASQPASPINVLSPPLTNINNDQDQREKERARESKGRPRNGFPSDGTRLSAVLHSPPPDGPHLPRGGGGGEGVPQRPHAEVRPRCPRDGVDPRRREGAPRRVRVRDRHARGEVRGDQGAGGGRQPPRHQRGEEARGGEGWEVSEDGEEDGEVHEEVLPAGERQHRRRHGGVPGRGSDGHGA
ncbi:17.1 kDa class II heat shock protein-like [Iris pallida]|uniref:17.1 kDa class II heat shock protein-like n=1 Tax=Iris pallida TaxID=29817 RepID=A0AAX6HTU8_IRIPA|nr:17.1 kDa class II heat shock protein-like [Iris pallida]